MSKLEEFLKLQADLTERVSDINNIVDDYIYTNERHPLQYLPYIPSFVTGVRVVGWTSLSDMKIEITHHDLSACMYEEFHTTLTYPSKLLDPSNPLSEAEVIEWAEKWNLEEYNKKMKEEFNKHVSGVVALQDVIADVSDVVLKRDEVFNKWLELKQGGEL